MNVGRQKRIQTAAILLMMLAALLVTMGDHEVIPVVVTGTTIDLFKLVGYSTAGFLTGYIFFSALQGEQE